MGAQYYDLKNVICTIREVRLEGFAQNDAVAFEWDDALVMKDTTADGQVVYSRINAPGLDAVISLMNTSETYRRLALLMDEQYGLTLGIGPPQILPMPFYMLDPATGDTVSSEYTVFLTRPAPVKAKQASVVQFRVSLPRPTVVFGAANIRLIP